MVSLHPIEKPAVVLDIGTSYTKAGYAGDFAPICIVPSVVSYSESNVWLRDVTDERELRTHLKTFLRHIYLKQLLCSMNDRQVVICESLLRSFTWKQAIAQVLLEDFGVLSVVFAPRHLLSLYCLGIQSALVVHSGYSDTTVLPVYENMVLLNSCQSSASGSKATETSLERLLSEMSSIEQGGKTTPFSEYNEKLSRKELEDIRVRTCFVTPFDRAVTIREHSLSEEAEPSITLPEPPKDVAYPLRGDLVLNVSGRVRELSCETLYDHTDSDSTLAHLVLNAILKCPIDARKTLASNIVVIGGNSMMPGFDHRLQQELKHLAEDEKYSKRLSSLKFCFHSLPVKRNYAAWLGGSIFGSSANLDVYSLTKQMFLDNNKVVPDWSNFQPETSNHNSVIM